MGLPKSLTELGWEISTRCYDRPGPTSADIMSVSSQIIKGKVRRFGRQFPDLMSELHSNADVRTVFRYLIESGVGQIFYVEDIFKGVSKENADVEVERAISQLIKLNLLTQTGINNDVVFFKDLSFTHTLSVISKNPRKYGLDPQEFAPLSQLSLKFP